MRSSNVGMMATATFAAMLVGVTNDASGQFSPNWAVTEGDWMEPTNWNTGAVPSGNNEASVANGGIVNINSETTSHRDFWVLNGTLNINDGGTLSNQRGMKVSGNGVVNLYAGGTVGGSSTLIGDSRTGSDAVFNQYGGVVGGSWGIRTAGTYNLHDGTTTSFTTFWGGTDAKMIQEGGSYTLTRSGVIGTNGTATYYLNDGTFTQTEGHRILHFGGGRLDVNASQGVPGDGRMIQTGGTATINGSLLIGSNGGVGSIAVSGGSFTARLMRLGDPEEPDVAKLADNHGVFTVTGSSPTAVHFTDGGVGWMQGPDDVLRMELDGGGVTPVTVSGSAQFDPDSIVDLNILSGFAATAGDTFNLMALTGTGSFTGMPLLAAEDIGTWSLGIDNTGTLLQATYVPEPAGVAVLGLVIPALLRRRRYGG